MVRYIFSGLDDNVFEYAKLDFPLFDGHVVQTESDRFQTDRSLGLFFKSVFWYFAYVAFSCYVESQT